MVKFIKRPEAPDLDKIQMAELRDHFSGLTRDQLKAALDQTLNDAQRDTGNYLPGSAPANVNRTVSILRELLEAKKGGGSPESK